MNELLYRDLDRATAELAAARAERDDYRSRLEAAHRSMLGSRLEAAHRSMLGQAAELERLRRVEAAARQVIEADDLMDDATVPGRVAVPAMRAAKLALRGALQGGQTGGPDER